MKLVRKKPVVVEAMRLENPHDVLEWMNAGLHPQAQSRAAIQENGGLMIFTLEGNMWALPGDWVIKGVKGEFYPCRPDIFAATYEDVVPADATLAPAVPLRFSHEKEE